MFLAEKESKLKPFVIGGSNFWKRQVGQEHHGMHLTSHCHVHCHYTLLHSTKPSFRLKQVPLVILWTWKTLGLLAPLLILLMPMFLLSTALDRLHLLYGHGLIMVLAPLLLAGVWALLLVQAAWS